MGNEKPACIPVKHWNVPSGPDRSPKGSRVGKLGGWRSASLVFLLGAATAVASSAQTFTSLVNFDGSNGVFPESLVQGADGKLWGTTANGGLSNCGTAFKITPAGVLTTEFSFNCTNANEGQGLILGTDGNYYGLTFFGGPNNYGTVFKLKPGGGFKVLLTFDGNDGSSPVGSLTEGTDGNFYGVTYAGTNGSTVFTVTPSGTLTTLHDFVFADLTQPYAGLVQGTDGNFYGTTYAGGNNTGGGGVFKITPKGAYTVLIFLESAADGSSPVASLVEGRDGDFYGTASSGGSDDDGTVFKITRGGVFTNLHNFVGTDGQNPSGALVQATDGNFYGTAAYGGANGSGTIFKMTAAGALTTLHSFDGVDGAGPYELVQHTDGTLYGITGNGGTSGYGTIFSLAAGLGPFVKTLPTLGVVGTNVTILGTNLTGATSVSFNGTAAIFTVVSSSEITTTVPTGATTGEVKVTTPHRTLSSNPPFHVAK
jgi:uncharacterized repeat protein (TIGR03803 family)